MGRGDRLISRGFALSALVGALCLPLAASGETPIVAEKTLALRTAMQGVTLYAFTVTQNDGVLVKAYVTHPDKMYLIATSAFNATFEISMSKAGTVILRNGKQIPEVPPALQAAADYLRTQWDTVSITREAADVDRSTGLLEVLFSGRISPDLKRLIPAQSIHCTYEKLTQLLKHCERGGLSIDFSNYQTVAPRTPLPVPSPTPT